MYTAAQGTVSNFNGTDFPENKQFSIATQQLHPESIFLSSSELEVLTGYTRYSEQKKWLSSRGWIFEITGSGKPIVTKQFVNDKLGVATQSKTKSWTPNLRVFSK
jgi:hypothetical protein